MTRLQIKYMVFAVLIGLVPYLLISLINLDFNLSSWHVVWRALSCLFIGFGFLLAGAFWIEPPRQS